MNLISASVGFATSFLVSYRDTARGIFFAMPALLVAYGLSRRRRVALAGLLIVAAMQALRLTHPRDRNRSAASGNRSQIVTGCLPRPCGYTQTARGCAYRGRVVDQAETSPDSKPSANSAT